nr:DUF4129 domain-containing protein [uncultured Methanoregula sp.]
MKKRACFAIIALMIAGILIALALTHTNPLLYSLDRDNFASRFHENAEALRQQSLNSTTDIDPELQDFIDFTGPVSLNIRIHDIDQARRELERFGKSHQSIKNLVVKLDMNESEIQELERDTALQKQILESLFNTSVSLDTLQAMEVQYHEQNNEDMLTTIRLQGDELRKKVQGMSGKYRNATESVIKNGKKLGLNVTKAEESQKYVDAIIKEIEQPQASRQIAVDTKLIPGEDRISLFLRPDSGRYRDIIEYQGISLTLKGNNTVRAAGIPITIYSEEIPLVQTTTDVFGYYNVKVPIERALIGPNIIYARSPTSRSVNRTLTAIPVDSVTTLQVSRPDSDGNVVCNGSVFANLPVRSASVRLEWDSSQVLITKTDAKGLYKKTIQLPPGSHTIVARFTGDDYPIYPSESDPVRVDISIIPGVDMDYRLITLVIVGIVILLLFLGAGLFYYRRISRQKTHILDYVRRSIFRTTPDPAPAGMDETAPDEGIQSDIPAYNDETIIMYYKRILSEHGLSAASRVVYQQLAGRVARDLRIRKHQALTPREMARTCKGKAYCGTFARFTAAYERVRYGRQHAEKDRTVFETAAELTDEQTGGENH